jgi:serine/threonine protein kinase
LREEYAREPRSNARLLFEAEVTGGLEHPSVNPVYGTGRHDDGRAFFTMRLIRGEDLKWAIGRLETVEDPAESAARQFRLLERFVDVCYTMDYAHGRGVVHWDLSPKNILLGQFGETVVIDRGLAKWVGHTPPGAGGGGAAPLCWPASAPGLPGTNAGHAIGTPCYLSPEQAAGRPDRHGPASDIYSLSAILYEVLTGRPPFEGSSDQAMRKAQVGDFPTPRLVRGDVPPVLEAVCLRAMALDPGDCFARALDLGDEVTRWMEECAARDLPAALAPGA